MADTFKAQGSCLCGAVKITAYSMKKNVGACHCYMCRNWVGGPLMTVDCGSDVAIEGDENVNRYSSSDWAERAFCKNCGTNLFYRLKDDNIHFICAGIFKDNQDLLFDHQIFIDEKPDYYSFANETKNMTGDEVFATYAPAED